MAEKEFEYDPEQERNTAKYRLPFALCKQKGIAIQDWWSPRDAWEDLRRGGHVDDVSEEYKQLYRQTCVAVFYARTLGYDVQALPNLNNQSIYALSVNIMKGKKK